MRTPTPEELERLEDKYTEWQASLKDLDDIKADYQALLTTHAMHIENAKGRYEAYAECIGLPQQLIA